jgi:tRNA (guanine37-N1)-methyltransferase
MKVDVLTLFPEMIEQALSFSIPARAQKSEAVTVGAHLLRQWGIDKHGNVDDTPYGGGPGMILRVDVADKAFEAVDPGHKAHRVMLTPDGEIFTQAKAVDYATKEHLVLLCGRYEGFDARIEQLVDEKVSIGRFVLSGGELPALAIVDALIRLLPGVLGNEQSLSTETFSQDDLTDFPQYTRPEVYRDSRVPEVLLSGHHAEIEKWRRSQQQDIRSSVDAASLDQVI